MKIIKFNEEICIRSDIFLSANLKKYQQFVENNYVKDNVFNLDNKTKNFFNSNQFMCLDVAYSDMKEVYGVVSISLYGVFVHYNNIKFIFENEITKEIDNALKIIDFNNLLFKYDNIDTYLKIEHKALYDKIENNTKFLIKVKNDLIDFLLTSDKNVCFNIPISLNRVESVNIPLTNNKIDIKVVE